MATVSLHRARSTMAPPRFRSNTSFPLVTAAVTDRGSSAPLRGSEAMLAPRELGDTYIPGPEGALLSPASASRRARQEADVRRFAGKQPIPCLYPTNRFIARTRKRDEEHLARSHLSFVQAMERLQLLEASKSGGHTAAGLERMALQPRVTLRYNDELDLQAREVCLCLCTYLCTALPVLVADVAALRARRADRRHALTLIDAVAAVAYF